MNDAAPTVEPRGYGAALHWIALPLVAATWLSGAIFGLYILCFFGGMVLRRSADRWNESLPHLHDAATPLATVAIGAHFVTGGILLLLGPIQLIGALRHAVPKLHRWLGRIYVLCAGFAGLGGLGFIVTKGTIGGAAMSTGFGIYGTLMTLCAGLTYASARERRFEQHRAWAIRLFALTVGSWLYRMEYGFWFLTAGHLGHSRDFSGWFDAVMAFFFYLPNLAVAECFIRGRRTAPGSAVNFSAAVVLLAATLFVVVATWAFTVDYWDRASCAGSAACHHRHPVMGVIGFLARSNRAAGRELNIGITVAHLSQGMIQPAAMRLWLCSNACIAWLRQTAGRTPHPQCSPAARTSVRNSQ